MGGAGVCPPTTPRFVRDSPHTCRTLLTAGTNRSGVGVPAPSPWRGAPSVLANFLEKGPCSQRQRGGESQSNGSMPSSLMSQTEAEALPWSSSRKPIVPYWVS